MLYFFILYINGKTMLFNSLHFLIFLPTTVILYFLLPHKYRWVCLLGASYYFYMSWNPVYALLILFTTGVNYFSAIQMGKSAQPRRRKAFLLSGVLSSLAVLFVFKYFNFLNQLGADILSFAGLSIDPINLKVLLPVGISFYTFQTLSYTIDVYRGHTEVEHHFGIFALYVSFFPQLVAGPIERSTNLLPQFYEKHTFDGERMREGILLMLWGLFKKMVIADRLAVFVNTAYAGARTQPGWVLLIATLFFAVQIYCDFSGYSDIAIGAARCMGFELMQNFDRPYLSVSIREFWHRWHISLSTWFRDYVYIPMGGSRVKKPRHVFNLMTTFVISGLWHGANITFVAWGFFHALFQVIGSLTSSFREKVWSRLRLQKSLLRKALGWVLTFGIVCALWVVFRAENMRDALYIYKAIAKSVLMGTQPGEAALMSGHIFTLGLSAHQLIAGIIAIVMLAGVELSQTKLNLMECMRRRHFAVWWTVIIFIFIAVLLFGVYGDFTPQEFIYFRF